VTHPAFQPGRLGLLELRNRIIKTATFEGMVVDGLPSAGLLRHHRDLARGGVGMTTVAYCAVSPDARTFAEQMVMRAETVEPLRAVTDAIHAEGAAAMLQLGHAGGFSRNPALRLRRAPRGPSFGLNSYGLMSGIPFVWPMRERDMAAVARDFATAALRAREAGFDAVELHLGHGYLLSQFLSPACNRRRDGYGGPIASRLRFPLRVVDAVREALGPAFPVLAKTNLDDGVRDGLHVEDAIEVARALEAHGTSAIVLSGGLVARSAPFLMRGDWPVQGMIEVETNPLQKLALRMLRPSFFRTFAFEPLFFLPLARRVRAAVRLPLVLLGGATSLDDLTTAMDQGFDFVAMGRALLHEPGLPRRWAAGETARSGCIPCNACVVEMDRPGGVVCARRPEQIALRAQEVARGLHRSVAGQATG
jgi:2,4-dienoyl-CoA reductase-like NADH-dependent reductase (Old Yellow Enzyme family)